ncbi:TPA: autotransporter outer membrane beta-barrel domain-containing protein [Yersinia enterocolitica]|nr:autotransporter outer membrane beta-barrel domain-containing protein [Yersinia enterocolitica]HDM8294994.1 autotransporter outer membrane beta-barrel domain-containing protein [Yersinia enterocolitica]HDM8319989.1 autotransporter outer membrane beta-barrel domain-containing protein [Yersinia enterocolitica]HDM8332975.1 autotransporter outer membrane beta-barrel domain-containing protein [Yersinia enterocolitica]
MHNSQHASKLFRPLFLTVAISNIIWPEFTMAQTREFTYSATIPGPSSVALSDAIAGDGNYNATINVDNPDKPLEVYFGQTETLQKTYDIGNYSVDIYGQNTTDSSYTVFFGLAVDSNNAVSINNFSYNNNLKVGGDNHHHNSTALIASDGSKVTIDGKVYINSLVEMDTSGSETASISNNGLYATGMGSTITANNGDVYINTYAKNFLELLGENASYTGGGAKSDAVSGKHGGQVIINETGQYQVNLLGNLDLGNAFGLGSSITVVLNGSDSYWHGTEANEYNADSNTWAGILDVTLMNKAQWIPDAVNAEISALTLQNGGTVNLHGFNLHTNKSQNEGVKVYDLKGSDGIFLIDVNISKTDDQRKNDSDFIEVVSSSTGGSHYIEALNVDKLANLSEDIWVADAASNVSFKADDQIDVNNEYVYDYKPIIRSDIRDGDPLSQYGTNWYISGIDKKLSAVSDTVLANAGVNYATATARLEIDSLNKRLGELRNDQQENGIWLRYKGGEMKSKDTSHFKNQYDFYQLGYDNKDEYENGIWTKGIAAHYLDGKSEFDYGSGDNKSYGGSLYSSWNRPDQQDYVDLVFKYSHLKSNFDYRNTLGTGGHGTGSNSSWSVSAEYGREFSLDNGNFIEPQGQLVYTYLNKADYSTNSGLLVSQDNINSVIGRAGVRVGHRFEGKSNNDIYLKADLLREFAGDRNVTIRGKDTVLVDNQNGKDNWIVYGIGTNIQFTEDNNSRFYLDLEKSSGGDINTQWQVNAGLRWEW